MNVVCKVADCPYNSKSEFCRNKLVSINQSGMCGHIYKKDGAVRLGWQIPIGEEFKEGYNEQQAK